MNYPEQKFEKLLATGNKELIAHTICDYADEIFYSSGVCAVDEPFRTVVIAETFFGEITNGGLYQYFSNDHGAFAVSAPAALEAIGLQLCAGVMRSALSLFPAHILKEDKPDYMAIIDDLMESSDDDPFEKIEAPFWEWFYDGNQDAIRECLHNWILKHKRDFVEKRSEPTA